MRFPPLSPKNAALLVVDIQEKLFPLVEHPCDMLEKVIKMVKGANIFHLPILVSEQYPKGLGHTVEAIKETAGSNAQFMEKTTFSCSRDPKVHALIESTNRSQWILVGIEAHVCILQTARSLLESGRDVIIANDAISSRSIYDFSTAIAELRDMGARITSVETILFELCGDSKEPQFKALSQLIKS